MLTALRNGWRAVPLRRFTLFAAFSLSFLPVAIIWVGGLASPAFAQGWADNRAHDKGCNNKTRVWHVRCEFSNGGWSHNCSNRSSASFRGIDVVSQRRLSDRAWSEVRTADASCGWPVQAATPDRTRAVQALTALDLAFQVREGRYDAGLPVSALATHLSVFDFLLTGEPRTGASGVRTIRPTDVILSNGWSKGTVFQGVSDITVYRRHSRHLINLVIFSRQDAVIVALWGTNFEENVPASIGVAAVVNQAYGGTWTHPGFAAVAYDLWPDIKREIQRRGVADKDLIITGHSMGGSVAGHLMFLALQENVPGAGKYNRLMTFGSPKYATTSFRDRFNQFITARYHKSKAVELEIEEDFWVNVTNIAGLGAYGKIGTVLLRPVAALPRANTGNVHAHTNYLLLADGL